MFIVDALLGNFDRHNGNWGILVDEEKQTAEIAPVYDCGSCLYPQLAAGEMKDVLEKKKKLTDEYLFIPHLRWKKTEKRFHILILFHP